MLRPTLQPQKYLCRKRQECKSERGKQQSLFAGEREGQSVTSNLYAQWTHFHLPVLSHARTNTHARTHDSLSARFLAFPFHGHVLSAFVRAVAEGLCTGTKKISMCSDSFTAEMERSGVITVDERIKMDTWFLERPHVHQ